MHQIATLMDLTLFTLHWLPLTACIKFKTLMLAYRMNKGLLLCSALSFESTPRPEPTFTIPLSILSLFLNPSLF